MQKAFEAYALIKEMAENGNPASITDAGVGALCIHTCIQGAALNVRINLGGLKNEELKAELGKKVAMLINESAMTLRDIMAMVESKMGVIRYSAEIWPRRHESDSQLLCVLVSLWPNNESRF